MEIIEGKEIRLAKRPVGIVHNEDFELVSIELPEIQEGQVLVQNKFLSLDVGMRLRMIDMNVPVPLYAVGKPMYGDAIGEVVVSKNPSLRPGDMVRHQFGWREFALEDANQFRKVDPVLFPSLSTHLSLGLTSYVGMLDIANLQRAIRSLYRMQQVPWAV